MGVFSSLVKKEILHIMRDPRTMVIVVVMPLVLLILFGFAISTEINNVNIAICIEKHDEQSTEIAEKFNANQYFTFKGLVNPDQVNSLMKNGDIDAALFLRSENGNLIPQIIVDASNPVMAQTAAMYIQGVMAGNVAKSQVIVHTLYNPQMKSAYNFVPGILGMIFILICAIMTSVSIVSEKENGTMNLLLVSPVRPGTIIFGKLVPYFLLSCIILAAMLLMSFTLLEIPISNSLLSVISISLLYILLSLSIGLLISSVVESQVMALIISAVIFMIPVIMLSGMIFPVDNMPVPLQYVSGIIPARWYISAMRKLMIQQLPLEEVTREVIILAWMTLFILVIAIKKFNIKR